MIQSLADKETARVFARESVRKFGPKLQRLAQKRLLILDAAESLTDLRVPVGNRLEKLKGNRAGQHRIRISDQWRICFRWSQHNAHDVEIVDYPSEGGTLPGGVVLGWRPGGDEQLPCFSIRDRRGRGA